MKFQFEVRSKTYPSRTWNNTIDFCIDHDHWIPHNFQKVILEIASNYGVYRKISLLDDKRGMLLYVTLPTNDLFSEWLSKRINYFHEVKNSEINKMMEDIQLTLQSLNYRNKEIKTILPIIIKEMDLVKKENNLSFENLLKLAMNYLDNNSSNLAR